MLKKENIDDQRLASPAFQGSNPVKSDKPNEDFPNNFNGAEAELAPNLPKLMAWSSLASNKVSIIEVDEKQNYLEFKGVQITKGGWTHVKEIPNTKLLISLNHKYDWSANMSIFDVSSKLMKKVYSHEEVFGVTGYGDPTYNSRRNFLGAISIEGRTAYHLFNIEYSNQNSNYSVKALKKAKWHSQYSSNAENWVAGLEFNPSGETVATIDCYGNCLISDLNTDSYIYHLSMGKGESDGCGRCRWSPNPDEPLLFIKYDYRVLNILDVERKTLLLTNPIQLEKQAYYDTTWIDVCQSNGNLLASGGDDTTLKIFDRRESKIVQTFDSIHSRQLNCVRWDPTGTMLASSSGDKTVKLLDFKTMKVLYTGTTSDGNYAMSICFL